MVNRISLDTDCKYKSMKVVVQHEGSFIVVNGGDFYRNEPGFIKILDLEGNSLFLDNEIRIGGF